jgi:hypothetical protein
MEKCEPRARSDLTSTTFDGVTDQVAEDGAQHRGIAHDARARRCQDPRPLFIIETIAFSDDVEPVSRRK